MSQAGLSVGLESMSEGVRSLHSVSLIALSACVVGLPVDLMNCLVSSGLANRPGGLACRPVGLAWRSTMLAYRAIGPTRPAWRSIRPILCMIFGPGHIDSLTKIVHATFLAANFAMRIFRFNC